MMPNKAIISFFLSVLTACATPKNERVYSYPETNPYPELFTTIQYSDGELLKVNIKSSSIELNCSKRNDQPYFWCGIDGNFTHPVEGLPKQLDTIFHVQLPEWAVNNVKSLLKQHKRKGHDFTVIIHRNPQIDKERNVLWNQLFSFYDQKFCVAFLGLEDELCPKGSEIQNIYAKTK